MATSNPIDLPAINTFLRSFVKEREWEQFHSPKNLVMALSAEVGELSAIFRWLSVEEATCAMNHAQQASSIRDELADILICAFRLADILELDLNSAIWTKLKQNAEKYPADLARGTAAKYSDLKKG
jgi:dCTP diphosphatase